MNQTKSIASCYDDTVAVCYVTPSSNFCVHTKFLQAHRVSIGPLLHWGWEVAIGSSLHGARVEWSGSGAPAGDLPVSDCSYVCHCNSGGLVIVNGWQGIRWTLEFIWSSVDCNKVWDDLNKWTTSFWDQPIMIQFCLQLCMDPSTNNALVWYIAWLYGQTQSPISSCSPAVTSLLLLLMSCFYLLDW